MYGYIRAALTVGTVDLAKERTKLVVRALEIPSDQAFNLKAVKLRQIKYSKETGLLGDMAVYSCPIVVD